MSSLTQRLDDFKLAIKTSVRFPPQPMAIFDLTRANIKEFLALVKGGFGGETVNIYERTPVIPSWKKEEPGPFRYDDALVEPDLSQIIFISDVNNREERIEIDCMDAVKFAFLRPTRGSYSRIPSGLYISNSSSAAGGKIPNPWYGRDEVVIATYFQSPKLRLL